MTLASDDNLKFKRATYNFYAIRSLKRKLGTPQRLQMGSVKVSLSLLAFLISVHVANGFFIGSIGFNWVQIVDTDGIAHSLEYSTCNGIDLKDRSITDKAEHEFMNYPQFLSCRKVLLGLITTEKKFNEQKTPAIYIRDSLFGINLLAFGEMEAKRFKENKIDQETGCTVKTIGVTVLISVVGGLLSRKQKDHSHVASHLKSLGTLKFQLMKTLSEEPQFKDNLRIETRILDFEPAIVGYPPVNFLRKTLYMITQRYFHAYVMWRFHRHCYNVILPTRS